MLFFWQDRCRIKPHWLSSFAPSLVVLVLGIGSTYALWRHLNTTAGEEASKLIREDFDVLHEQKCSDIEVRFDRIYDALRTMAILPGIRKIDRHGHNLDGDAKASATVIYRNLVSDIDLSEIYIVPATIEPDKIDPVTGRTEEPILSYDSGIKGHSADGAPGKPSELPEVEIYEYHALKQQCRDFTLHYPTFQSIRSEFFPALVSKRLITCDNTEFSKADLEAHNDEPRMGIIYSVPFYGTDDKFKGTISAIIRVRVIQRWLDSKYQAIYKAGLSIPPDVNLPDDAAAYPYLKTSNCKIVDSEPWTFRTAVPLRDFNSRPDFEFAQSQTTPIWLGGIILSLAIAALVWSLVTGRTRALLLARSMTSSLAAAKDVAESANRAKSDFLARMSHEIRTPLNGVVGMIDALAATDLNQTQQQYAHLAHDAVDGLLLVISDILDFSKIEAGKIELEHTTFDLYALVEDLCKLFTQIAGKKNLTLACLLRPDVPCFVKGDPGRLRQVLLNLISNALKFTPQGCVSVRVTLDGQKDESNIVRFQVQDTGIGIPTDRLDRLFKSFSQVDTSIANRFGGTGLGLAICKRLVGLMDGEIGIESTTGVGTTFWFTVPFDTVDAATPMAHITSASPSSTAAPDSQHQSLRGMHVLVAEDNEMNQFISQETLRRVGCTCEIVANGALAVQAVQSRQFAMVLMDCQMPEMDGLEASQRIREHEAATGARRIPIIALTAAAIQGDRERCLAAGMDAYVSKPIKAAELFTTMEIFVAEKAVI